MKAIILKEPGEVENLIVKDIAVPEITDGEVLIKVSSISINPVDVKTRIGSGVYQYANLGNIQDVILGWDIAGVVTLSKSEDFKPGDEVFGMINFVGLGKAYAEYVAAPANHLALKPLNINFNEAAAATLAALTALQVLSNAGIKPGDRVLIHAASGGVGHYAVQIAKTMGAYVIGTSSESNRDLILGLGADEHIDYNKVPFEKVLNEIDFVLDCIGVENIKKSLEVIKSGGQLTTIVTPFTDELQAIAKPKNIKGQFHMVQSNGGDMKTIADLLAQGKIRSLVSKVFLFEDMASAHKQLESQRTIGKIIVSV